ncbi:alpha/beta hydrolase [Sutcliffiella horikoshii]|uniref:alpha/beta fold hydrolase n=1 Tax=Sutcliffiella horikoshii TaxID=79883 RepID=UPI00203EA9AE|nr:alpha/beta hydrolase [Sutcliffiella horikoshii]MCM3618298.1 alpha/beta hydrolase [Sutcliffiella horikoshii]
MWKKNLVETERGSFEYFAQGQGEPIAVTHLYSEFNELGNYFADMFLPHFTVHLINLKDAGNSVRAEKDEELSMKESVKDLEAIRKALGFERWAFGGHSTGGMLGLLYATLSPGSLTKLMVGGATASNEYMKHEGSMYSATSPLNKRVKEILQTLNSPESTVEERREAGKEWTDISLYNPGKREEYFVTPSSGKVVPKRLDYFSYHDLQHFDILQDLENVMVPVVVYGGRYDAQCPLVFSEEIHSRLPQSTLVVFEESNHYPFVEEKEKFAEMISKFNGVSAEVLR